MKIFDVCNDYELQPSEHKEKPEGYEWKVKQCLYQETDDFEIVEFGYCKKSNELHFLTVPESVSLNDLCAFNTIIPLRQYLKLTQDA